MAVVQTSQGNKSSFKNILFIVLLVLMLMLMASIVAYFVARNFTGNTTDQHETVKQATPYSAGDFLTNLSDRGYIKVSLVYLLDSKELEKELQSKDFEIRDRIFTILRSKNYDSVKDSRGMEELRKQIKSSINSLLTTGKITDVYFTSIIVN